MTKNAELIARLEASEVGSRELGRDVLVALSIVREFNSYIFYGVGNQDVWHFGEAAEIDGADILPDPTTSLDAALALAMRVLPLGSWVIKSAPNQDCMAAIYWTDERFVSRRKSAPAKTPALALCVAILKALDHGN